MALQMFGARLRQWFVTTEARGKRAKVGKRSNQQVCLLKTSGWAGWVLPCSLWRPRLGSVHGFWILHSKIYQPFCWEVAISKP